MCFAALDYYYANKAAAGRNVKGSMEIIHVPCERQLDSLKISVVLKVIEWMLIEDRVALGSAGRSYLAA
jgi:hypothetical protein